ncbi:MAG: tetratricopeptide repeat protein, partial [Acidobacteriaceae bacterium]|nr:tetratricopeptide repeat protein [Acidobacteriaceae bacterium]
YLSVGALLIAVTLLAGCHGNPNVRKQKYMESGRRFSSEGKYREAAIQFLNALKVDKDYPDAHYELAETYEHLGQLNAASVELAHTVDLEPANFKARVDLGNLLFAGGRTEEAQAQAYAVMAAQPNNPGVHALLSAIAGRRGQKDQALIEIQRALELDPNRAAFHENLALLLSDDPTKNASVEDELKKAIALDPKSVNSKLLLAAFYARNNRLAEAEKISWDAVAVDPRSVAARANVAQVILQQGDRMRAEKVIRQAAKDLADNPQGGLLLANYYASSGQLDQARAEFSGLAAKYPKNVSLLKGYARILIQVRDYAAARALISGLMKSGSKDPEVAVLNGMVLLGNGNPNEAVNILSENAGDFPQDASIQLWLGKAAMAKGDITLAEQSFRRAAGLNPSSLDAQQELARIATLRGDMSLLEDVAENTIVAAPQIPQGYDWRAIVELNRSLPEKAEADLKTAMTVAPQNAQAYLQLGKLCLAQKRFPEAGKLLEQALQYDPNSSEALGLLVDYDVYQKQPDKALARVRTQIEKSPRNSSFYDLLAQQQMRNKDLTQAAATARKAIQLNSSDDQAVILFAQIAVQLGQTANAVNAWTQWSNAHPDDAGALAILGTLEESRGDLNKAETYYKRSLQIQPQQPIAANNLAYRMLQKGESQDVALTLAQTARQSLPDSPNTADTLAWAYYCNGTYKFSRDLLEDAIKENPNSATMQYHLGMVYSKLRDKNNAAIHLKKAISLAHDSETGKEARTALQGLG